MPTVSFVCDVPASVYLGGKEISDEPVLAPTDGRLAVSVLPALSDVARLSYTVVLRFANGRLTSTTGGASVLDWGEGIYEVRLLPPLLPVRHSPITLAQSGEKSLATLYDDGEMHLMCEGATFFVHDVPRLVTYSLTSSEQGEFLVVLRGNTESKQYILVLSSAGGGTVLHEHLADRIEPTEEGVLVTERIVDMQSRTRTTLFRSGGAVLRREFSGANRRFPDLLLPYALLEAVQCGDLDEACRMLSPELAVKDALADFFGEFDVVCPPKTGDTNLIVATYKTSEGLCLPRRFQFEVAGGVITSVHEI